MQTASEVHPLHQRPARGVLLDPPGARRGLRGAAPARPAPLGLPRARPRPRVRGRQRAPNEEGGLPFPLKIKVGREFWTVVQHFLKFDEYSIAFLSKTFEKETNFLHNSTTSDILPNISDFPAYTVKFTNIHVTGEKSSKKSQIFGAVL